MKIGNLMTERNASSGRYWAYIVDASSGRTYGAWSDKSQADATEKLVKMLVKKLNNVHKALQS